jgi:hypothetical protein
MSANSLFRDFGGERDPVYTQRLTTPLYGGAGASGTVVAPWKLAVPDKCSITRVDVLWGTAGSGASGARQLKLKVFSIASGGSSHTAKVLCVGTIGASQSRNFLKLLPASVITLPADSAVGFAQNGGTPTGALGMYLGVYVTKGHVQA